MRSFNFFFFLVFFVFIHKIISQELNAQVIVNSNLVNQTNQQIFQTLEKSLNEFLNNQSWTNKEFLSNEKITVALFLPFRVIKMTNLRELSKFNLKDQFLILTMIAQY